MAPEASCAPVIAYFEIDHISYKKREIRFENPHINFFIQFFLNSRGWSEYMFPLRYLARRECERQMEKDVSQDVSDHKQFNSEVRWRIIWSKQ